MGLLNLPRIPRNASPDQMANIYNMAIEEVEHRVNGFLQSSNIQEVGGWIVADTTLQSKDSDVGMSTIDTAGDDVRFWAGGTNPETAPWRVHKSGKNYLTGAHVQSSSSYPRVVIDPTSTLVGAYTSPTDYIAMQAQTILGFTFPYLDFSYAGYYHTYLFQDINKFGIQSMNDIDLYAAGYVTIPSWSKLMAGGETLQSVINNLQSQINGKASLYHSHSGSVTVPEGGGTVSFTVS